jgi:hypothetical protein
MGREQADIALRAQEVRGAVIRGVVQDEEMRHALCAVMAQEVLDALHLVMGERHAEHARCRHGPLRYTAHAVHWPPRIAKRPKRGAGPNFAQRGS